ncbi:MAG TPA: CDP-alcohol phosphatidyltransferase family protein [Candidatus Binatia bacterium]|nr:CDP-alcohol phosphatidyltransferase family protein [Candidatus Binatia bacterium]
MPPPCRPWTAATAAVVIGITIALALRGVARTVVPADSNEPRDALIGPRVRAWYRGVIAPVEDALVAWRIHPDALTWAQLGVSVLAGAAFWAGWIFLGGWLTILAGTLDILDGGVARRGGIAGPRGALVDSLVDRWAEFVTFVGLGAFFRDGWMLLAVAVAAFASQMVSYTRARAEGLGLELRVGGAQRPERYVALGFGAWVSDLVAHLACGLGGPPTHVVLQIAVVGLAALSLWTALERSWVAVRALARRTEAR